MCHPISVLSGPSHWPWEGWLPACGVQQWTLPVRQLDAPSVLLWVGEQHPGAVQLHRPGPKLEWEAVPTEHVDQKGLWSGLPLLLLPLWPGTPEKRHRLVPGETHAGRAQEKVARERELEDQHYSNRRWRLRRIWSRSCRWAQEREVICKS